MHKHRPASTALALALAFAPLSAAFAADQGANQQTENRLFPRGAQQVIGQAVVGADGQKVGEVRDVVIGREGQVEGIVVERGGIAGVGGKQVAIGWDQFAVNPDGGLLVSMDDNQLSQLPEYDEGSRTLIESPPRR